MPAGSKVVTRIQSDNSDNTDNVLPTMQSLDIKRDSILQNWTRIQLTFVTLRRSSRNWFHQWSFVMPILKMGQATDKSPRPIIITFVRRIGRNEFLNLRKMKRNLGYACENSVFTIESLTPANRELLRLTRDAAKEKNYSKVWTNNCNIFVPKERVQALVIKITSDQDIDKL
ncbi:hypothetical protein J6590_051490 [Homalodisca vitripennis]|nr:hypothetical protein J6590_051490 [Homalodisca vitripennis]